MEIQWQPNRKKDSRVKLDYPFYLVGVQGFEPWTPWSQTRCATGLRHTPKLMQKLYKAIS